MKKIKQMNRKTISVTFSINTVQNPIQLAEGIAKIFENSILSIPEFNLKVEEIKTIKDTKINNED